MIYFYIFIYKISKIPSVLWLVERCVCMRVCEHGCDVKMFCFSCANHASTNLKKVLSWNLRNLWKNAVSIFFRLSWLFKREKPVFRKAFFCKTKTDYAFKLRVQDFATGQNFSFNQCPKQKSFAFFLGKVILKPTENFFPVFAYPYVNTGGVGRMLHSYANPRLRLGFAQLSPILQPLSCLYQAMQTKKTFSIA